MLIRNHVIEHVSLFCENCSLNYWHINSGNKKKSPYIFYRGLFLLTIFKQSYSFNLSIF